MFKKKLFSVLQFPICTKSFAFDRFETRLKITRTYCPHEVDQSLLKNGGVGRRKMDKDKEKPTAKEPTTTSSGTQVQSTLGPIAKVSSTFRLLSNYFVINSVFVIIQTPALQKARLNKILLNLLSKVPTKQVVDVSYLLEGGRRRKKQDALKQ